MASHVTSDLLSSTYWGRDKMAATSHRRHFQINFLMKMFKFRLKFHWSVPIDNFQALVRIMACDERATNHYLTQWRPRLPTHMNWNFSSTSNIMHRCVISWCYIRLFVMQMICCNLCFAVSININSDTNSLGFALSKMCCYINGYEITTRSVNFIQNRTGDKWFFYVSNNVLILG